MCHPEWTSLKEEEEERKWKEEVEEKGRGEGDKGKTGAIEKVGR